jgi:hypothetical protein
MIFSHVLYRLSYPATKDTPDTTPCAGRENIHLGFRNPRDHEAGATGLEPATSDVTGRRSNQLNYAPALCQSPHYLTSGRSRI